ncbi:MAG: DUF4332 domain-containing protein [Anaerolineales bacterium]|nr:DUF4332 domain-containing protein [Anaerolineales bacterium]
MAERCGLPVDDILELANLSDLTRLCVVNSVRASLYLKAGIDTSQKC